MIQNRTLRELAMYGCMGVCMLTANIAGRMYLRHNTVTENNQMITMNKANNPFSFSSLTIDKTNGDVCIIKKSAVGVEAIVDEHADGIADYIIHQESPYLGDDTTQALSRDEDLADHTEAFVRADQELYEQVDRFRPLLMNWLKEKTETMDDEGYFPLPQGPDGFGQTFELDENPYRSI